MLLLLGPLYLRVTECPAGIAVTDALRVAGTIVSVAATGADVVVPEPAIAWNTVVCVSPLVL
jgi:hypothetical protein